MPLPPALLAKLQKRGIVKNAQSGNFLTYRINITFYLEGGETFVEHYDANQDVSDSEDGHKRSGAPGCPNKWIPCHFCTDFCYDHWGDGIPENR